MKTLFSSLYDAIEGRNCGVVIYPDKTVISHIWGGDSGLPKVSPTGHIIMWPAEEFTVVDVLDIDDCQSELPETDWAYISEEDFADLAGQAGKKYLLSNGVVVIHPESWR